MVSLKEKITSISDEAQGCFGSESAEGTRYRRLANQITGNFSRKIHNFHIRVRLGA